MKRFGLQLWLVCAICAAAVCSALGQREEILQFDSQIAVQTNGSLVARETLRVRAQGGQIRHGIYRDFPQLYRGFGGLRTQTGFGVLSVKRDGQLEQYHQQDRHNGTRVYVGSEGTVLSPGIYTYELVYQTDHQLGFFASHDELYWNVTGNGWVFPIAKVRASVTLPEGATPANLEAYTGAQGAKGKDYQAAVVDGRAQFETTRALLPGEGLTIVVTWPKGFVAQPGFFYKWTPLVKANRGVAFAVAGVLLALIYYSLAWFVVGVDPPAGTIIPQYGPPRGFSPAAVRYLAKMEFDDRTMTAAILNLAAKGKLTIHEEEGEVYTLSRTKAGMGGLAPEETDLLSRLFEDGPRLSLLQANYQTLQDARTELMKRLAQAEEKTYFVRNQLCLMPGVLFLLAGLGLGFFFEADYGPWDNLFWLLGAGVAGAILFALFYYLLKAPTSAGRRILDQIEGFKLYLSVAEKDRLNLEHPPERTPELFEQFLPYALALGVEQKWAEQFAAVLAAAGQGGVAYAPSWYSGHSWCHSNVCSMTHMMSSSLSSAISSASTAPGSSSGSSSGGGGGGGGSSGGGGGGGGGGGW